MTRTTLTPAPTIEDVLDLMHRNLSPCAADFTRSPDGAAVAIYNDIIAVRVGYEWRDEKHDGHFMGRCFITICSVRLIFSGREVESFEPRSVEAAANWLVHAAVDYAGRR